MTPQVARNVARQDQCEAAQDEYFRSLSDDVLFAMLSTAILVDQTEDLIMPKPLARAALVALMIVGTKELVRRMAEAEQR